MLTQVTKQLSLLPVLTAFKAYGLCPDFWALFAENQVLLAYTILVNIGAFVIFGLDKLKAKNSSYRIPEKTLFTFALMGGTPGAILAMLLFRHKTRKASFVLGLPLILILQLVLVLYTLNVTHP